MSIIRVSFALLVSRPDLGLAFFSRNAREVPVKERWWPRFEEPDLRYIGSREVARQPPIINGCFARK